MYGARRSGHASSVVSRKAARASRHRARSQTAASAENWVHFGATASSRQSSAIMFANLRCCNRRAISHANSGESSKTASVGTKALRPFLFTKVSKSQYAPEGGGWGVKWKSPRDGAILHPPGRSNFKLHRPGGKGEGEWHVMDIWDQGVKAEHLKKTTSGAAFIICQVILRFRDSQSGAENVGVRDASVNRDSLVRTGKYTHVPAWPRSRNLPQQCVGTDAKARWRKPPQIKNECLM